MAAVFTPSLLYLRQYVAARTSQNALEIFRKEGLLILPWVGQDRGVDVCLDQTQG